MGNKLCQKVILEGKRLTFKTEIAFELNERPRVVGPRKYRYHSPLTSANGARSPIIPGGVNRFHISTQAYQKQSYNKNYDFHWLEEQLFPLNFRIVFCTRSPESFEAARRERLKVSGNSSQYNDLSIFVRE